MNRAELVKALKCLKVQTGSLACLGCGREHNCSMHGCAIIRAAVEELEKVQWVSVEERLPEEKQRVIVRCSTVGTTVGWILWGEWMTDLGRGYSDVTHWMPLPEPMEKKEREKP